MNDLISDRSAKQAKMQAARATMLARHNVAVEEIENNIIARIEGADQEPALSVETFLRVLGQNN
jgi:hypothetical protein